MRLPEVNRKRVMLGIEDCGYVLLFVSVIDLFTALLHKDNTLSFCVWTFFSAYCLVLGIRFIREGEKLRKIDNYRLALR